MNIMILISASAFVPLAVFAGMKLYGKTDNRKLFRAFALVLLAAELVKFFYNAALYEKARTPAADLTFTFQSVICVLALFAAFNKGRIGAFCKKTLILTAAVPLIIALFNPDVYTNTLDIHAVVRALYFAESGIIFALMMLAVKDSGLRVRDMLFALAFFAAAMLINFFTNWFWKVRLTFPAGIVMTVLMLAAAAAGIAAVYGVYILIKFLTGKKAGQVPESTAENG